jgi:hypothetical protein
MLVFTRIIEPSRNQSNRLKDGRDNNILVFNTAFFDDWVTKIKAIISECQSIKKIKNTNGFQYDVTS